MNNWLKNLFGKREKTQAPIIKNKKIKQRNNILSVDFPSSLEPANIQAAFAGIINNLPPMKRFVNGATMDSSDDGGQSLKWSYKNNAGVSQAIVDWYKKYNFIGYQLCAMLSQHPIIKKCCSKPAKDAIRKGYDITINDGKEIEPDILGDIRKLDKEYQFKKNMQEFVTKGKIFGIRVCIFLVDSDDPDYYKKPFNIDSVKPGSYRGISQVDPYWITPQPSDENTSNPASQHFYEPDWWQVNGKIYHRTHLAIYREDDDELPDVLKPTYVYGGVSVPQKIYNRVYAAERTADEAPLLALTKRTKVYKTDLSQAISKGQEFWQKIVNWVGFSNNHGVQCIGLDDDIQQLDTNLADLDNVIMTQYQLVCAYASMQGVNLLETSPKGFNATGENEESNYHETLEGLQDQLNVLCYGHYKRMIKSEIMPKFGVNQFDVDIIWKPLDSMTAKEEAEVNNIKADTDVKLSQAGTIDGNDSRDRIIADPNSGYSGISSGAPENEEQDNDIDWDGGDEQDS